MDSMRLGRRLGLAVVVGLVVGLTGGVGWAEKHKPILAVFEIEVSGFELREMAVKGLTEYLGASLSEGGRFSVMPSSEIRKTLLEKSKESHKRCFDKKCQIEIGRALAANKTLSTKIHKLGNKCYVTCQVFDLKTQTADTAKKAGGGCSEEGLVASIDSVAKAISGTRLKTNSTSDLETMIQRSRNRLERRERAAQIWKEIKFVAEDDKVPFDERAKAVRVYLEEFGEDSTHYEEALRMLAAIPSSVRVTSEPTNADIWVDDKYKGKTPILVNLLRGQHQLKAARGDCFDTEKTIEVEPGEIKAISVDLERASMLRIDTKPSGAEVAVDGTKVGKAPIDGIKVKAGRHAIVASYRGYSPAERTVHTEPGVGLEVDMELKEKPAELLVETSPAGASISIDGQAFGNSPQKVELERGTYRVTAALGGYSKRDKEVQLGAGQRETIRLLLPRLGELEIVSAPPGAMVEIDGEEIGITPVKRKLEKGTYRIVMHKSGYEAAEYEQDVFYDKVTSVTKKLEWDNPYSAWAHAAFWSGVGLAGFGGAAAGMAVKKKDDYVSGGKVGAGEESQIWEGMMWSGLGLGAALITTGVLLWLLPGPEETTDAAPMPSISIPMGEGGGLVFGFSGTW